MTAPSPSRRQRKTDLADLLKGHSTTTPRAVDNPPPAADASSVRSSSKLSILPFLTRTRTKSVTSRSTGNTEPDSSHSNTNKDVPSRPSLAPTLSPSISTPSLGSKLAAHLAPLRHRRSQRTKLEPEQTAALYDSTRTVSKETLQPPSPTRRSPSFDSALSSASRSVTPRPQQPTITVSHAPREREDLDEFADLFTLPSSPKSTERFPRISIPSSAEAVLSRIPTPSQDGTEAPTIIPAPINKATIRRRPHTAEIPVPIPTANSSNKPLAEEDTPATRSEMSRRTRPVKQTSTIPPPSGPPPTPPPNKTAAVEPRSLRQPSVGKPTGRPRAHTFSTSRPPTSPLPRPPSPKSPPLSPAPTPAPTSPQTPSLPPSLNDILKPGVIGKENVQTATVEQLREALMAQYVRFDQLAAYVTTVTDLHSAEKALLEDRIDVLEKEAKKREKEMKGLRWLVMNNGAGEPSSGLPQSNASVRSAPTHDPPSRQRGGMSRRVTLSPRTNSESESGFESPLGVSSIIRRKKTPASHLLSAGSGSTPYLSSSSKRSSISSFTSSAASSTSSLVLQSPSLSAIPETQPLVRTSHELSTPTSSEPEFDKKRGSYISPVPHRLSSSSTSSSASALHYTPKVSRSRPSSIAQVLHQSSGMSPRRSKEHF